MPASPDHGSLGAYRVGADSNPSSSPAVARVKEAAAALIDRLHAIPTTHGEARRLQALAMTAAEEAALWGVKAATKTTRAEE